MGVSQDKTKHVSIFKEKNSSQSFSFALFSKIYIYLFPLFYNTS